MKAPARVGGAKVASHVFLILFAVDIRLNGDPLILQRYHILILKRCFRLFLLILYGESR
jgi:hypothetical protein